MAIKQNSKIKNRTIRRKNRILNNYLIHYLPKPTHKSIMAQYNQFGFSESFSRDDVVAVCGITKSPTNSLLNLMKRLNLITTVDKGH